MYVNDLSLAVSYLHDLFHYLTVSGCTEIALARNESKYFLFPPDFVFQLIAFKSIRPLNLSGLNFFEVHSCFSAFWLRFSSVLITVLIAVACQHVIKWIIIIIMSFIFVDEDPDL